MWISKKKWNALNERVEKLEKDTSIVVGREEYEPSQWAVYTAFCGLPFAETRMPLKRLVEALMERLRLSYEVEPQKPAVPKKIKIKAVRSK